MAQQKLFIGRLAIGALFFSCAGLAIAQPHPASGTWITAWGTSQQGLGMTAVSNATVRMMARVTIPGDAVRIRLDNTFGTTPLRIGRRLRRPADSGGGAGEGIEPAGVVRRRAGGDDRAGRKRGQRSGDAESRGVAGPGDQPLRPRGGRPCEPAWRGSGDVVSVRRRQRRRRGRRNADAVHAHDDVDVLAEVDRRAVVRIAGRDRRVRRLDHRRHVRDARRARSLGRLAGGAASLPPRAAPAADRTRPSSTRASAATP